MSEFNLTLTQACDYLSKSPKTLSRYIKKHLLFPEKGRSKQGTLEYRFSKDDLDAFKIRQEGFKTGQEQPESTGQPESKEAEEQPKEESEDETDKPDKTERTEPKSWVTSLLEDQLKIKDTQIQSLGDKVDQLIERNGEVNILIGRLQAQVLGIKPPEETNNGAVVRADEIRQTDKAENAEETVPKKKPKWLKFLTG